MNRTPGGNDDKAPGTATWRRPIRFIWPPALTDADMVITAGRMVYRDARTVLDMELGLCTISNKDATVDEIIPQAAAAGYDGIEVWGRNHVDGSSESACRRIRNAAADHDLAVLTYGSYLRAGTDTFTENLQHEVNVADRLDVDRFRVWAGDFEYGDHTQQHWQQTVDDLRTLTTIASERGFEVTVEKHPGSLTNEAEGASRLISAVDEPACRLNYQPMFSLSAGEIRAEMEQLAPVSNQMHLQAVPRSGAGGDERCPLSEAFYDLEFLVDLFRVHGTPDGSIHVEFVTDELPYEEAVTRDCEYLQSLLD